MAQESPGSMTPPADSPSARRAREPLARDTADTRDIAREIERTRVEMSETLGEIQQRLRPDHLMQQAKHTVRAAATGKVRSIMHSASETATRVADQTRDAGRNAAEYARTHPLQMAVLAGAATWWLLRSRQRSDEWPGASEGWRQDAASSGGEDHSLRERAGEYVSSARDRGRQVSARVRDAASTASVRARQAWRSTSTSVDDWVHEYPLAAGALAVAMGAAIGLSVPGTEAGETGEAGEAGEAGETGEMGRVS